MKVINAKQDFKVVRDTQVKRLPELADRLGKKRESVNFELPVYEAADVAAPEFVAANGELLVTCLNNALSELAKAQFAANASNWEFVPTVESLSLEALKASFESVSKGRILTLENAGKLAIWLQSNMSALVAGIQTVDADYKPAQLTSIIAVIGKYTAYESKSADFAAKVASRISQIIEAVTSDDLLAESFIEDATLPAVLEALLRKFEKSSVEDEIDVDAL